MRVVKSHRAGVGKSLKARRLSAQMSPDTDVRISMHRKYINTSDILRELLKYATPPEQPKPRLFHLDIAHEVQEGVDDFLFNLVVLGSLTDQEGYVWRRSVYDLYVIEAMPIVVRDMTVRQNEVTRFAHEIFNFLPSMTCWSPTESLHILSGVNRNTVVTGM